MELIQTFFLATLMSFLGFLLPGMINMTVVKVSLEQSKSNALKFIFGSIVIIGVQAFIAIYFSKYLADNPQIVNYLSYIGIVVFIGLSVMFYFQAKSTKAIGGLTNGTFLAGVKMTTMNMLAIPFFLGYSTAMEASGVIENQMPNNIFFVAGAVFGAFLLFIGYMFLADFIQRRAVFVARNINYILSGLFFVLAILAVIKILA